MQIQQLTSDEFQRLRAVRLRALRDTPEAFATTFEEAAKRPLEDWIEQLSKLATFVAVLDNRDVGMARGARPDAGSDMAMLISMWVAPEARRRGVGAALVDAVIDWARAHGFARLHLEVVDDNAPAIALYTRRGFEPTGRTTTMPPPRHHIREHERVLDLRSSSRARIVSPEESAVHLATYDSHWPAYYDRESKQIAEVFREAMAAIEHIGSTSVPGLLAKPIIDIMVGARDGSAPSSSQLDALASRGYEFHGEDGRRPGRWFWRKRGEVSFDVSLVRFMSELWNDNLILRDYLRAHADEARRYAEAKIAARHASPTSMLGYQNAKRAFVEELKARARR